MTQVSNINSKSTDSPQSALSPRSKLNYLIKCWNDFTSDYLSFYNNKDLKFEELAAFLQNKSKTRLFIKVWKLLKSTINKYKYDTKVTGKDVKESRMILSSLMIYHFPLDMLDENDTKDFKSVLSQHLYISATELIQCLVDIPNINKNSEESCKKFYGLINKFLENFEQWKQKDVQKLLDSLKYVYREWVKSHKVMDITELHKSKKGAVLNTLNNSKNNVKQKIIKLVGNIKAQEICETIENEVANEPEILLIKSPKSESKKSNDMDIDEEKDNEKKEETIEQKLAAKGVPMKIKSGYNLLKQLPKKEDNNNNNNDKTDKYIEEYKGKKVLNLDKIIAEVSAKKYWDDFAEQIEQKKFERLFELLIELLDRIKKLSPKKSHKGLDDLIDVKFIEQTINNGLLDAKGFYGIFYGIHAQLKSIHAPINDKIWDEWHDTIVKDMSKEEQSWSKLLPMVFNKFLMKIDEIEDQINAIRAVQNKKKQSENN